MKTSRGSLYLLTGLILGIALGLIYTWQIRPAQAVDTAPISLQVQLKDEYRAMIATAFVSSGDLVRARARLKLLGGADSYTSVVGQAERLAAHGETGEVTALRLLGAALSLIPLAPGE